MTTDKPEEAATGADNTEVTESSGDSTADKDQEVVLIQDTGFNVKIVCPGVEEFELPVCCCYQIVFVVVLLCHHILKQHTYSLCVTLFKKKQYMDICLSVHRYVHHEKLTLAKTAIS